MSGPPSDKQEREREQISQRVKEAEASLRALLHGIAINLEEKIAIEDQITNLGHAAESMLGRMDGFEKAGQKKILLGYKAFLENNLEAVNKRLKDLG